MSVAIRYWRASDFIDGKEMNEGWLASIWYCVINENTRSNDGKEIFYLFKINLFKYCNPWTQDLIVLWDLMITEKMPAEYSTNSAKSVKIRTMPR